MQELVLELRHVHVRRALGLAPLALEAEVHDLVQAFPRELGGWERAREHGPERVGAPARRVLLVLRRHVRGAHRALERLAAHADAVAQLHGRGEAALAGEVEERRRLPGRVADAVAEILDDPDRKSTRLNSSHLVISYAVFCLKKKKKKKRRQ